MNVLILGLLLQLSLPDLVKRASSPDYPQVRVSQHQIEAASAAIHLARTAYLPRVEGIAQINRATRNNIYGMLLPQTVIPPISGPPNPTNAGTNVWGSAVGFLVAWEPFDFGLRRSQVEAAAATRRLAEQSAKRTQFELSVAAADAYLTLLAAEQTATAARASTKRSQTFLDQVAALVNAELRPGAEASRAKAELAAAETQRIQADQAVAIARAALAQFAGAPVTTIKPLPDPAGPTPTVAASHPAVSQQQAAIDEAHARRQVLDRSYYPRFTAQAATYARGTGANPDFTTQGGVNGLGPNIYNWGLGFSVNFNVMDYASLRARKQAEEARERTEAARLDQVKLDLSTQLAKAQALLDGARAIQANLPVQLEAARATETQATARYRAGLGTIAEVAETQRLLTQTEIDVSLAKLAIWRAQLGVAAAQGSLDSFLAAAGQ
ncbi:MAG: TolC family protein [Bryobacterales bacterium]|nr:TolC family protein [Bryobacterales bacterium]